MFATMPVNFRLALRSLNRNRMRTLLTMLGIIIGVAAVLTMVALGTGARGSVEGEITSAGTNLVFVKAGNYTRGGESVGIVAGRGAATSLVPADAEAIVEQVDGVLAVSPGVAVRTFLTSGEARAFARVQGIAPAYAEMYSWNISPGRMFSNSDTSDAILGRALADQLFGAGSDPVGQVLSIRNHSFTVIGVTDGQADDHADVVFVPWATLQGVLGLGHIESITLAAEKAGEASRIQAEITNLLRLRHGISDGSAETQDGYLAAQSSVGGIPDDFTVETQAAQALTRGLYTPAAAFALANLPKLDEVTLDEMSDTLDKASNTMTALLASIAGVSLVVGGIGIMNIMLVSVTERTREIGLRMAAGARSADVALQFLVEAITLSLLGGLIGLVTGILCAQAIGWSLGWPAEVPLAAMALAIGIAGAVGLLFGSYPARRASLLDPIDALRTE
ncbi:FtsX-like permease family protein [Parahaliea maris]|uniref:FtsX-like permease family protein n=1 Tax=Parahaliea maris TaxID=2716870 RepID=A0A5C8ZX53_9GAMM|nr:ABC transporter permease [Parahaliea maris]TXS92057.1 FtsX-like permease family protein [Parahaliea maris]